MARAPRGCHPQGRAATWRHLVSKLVADGLPCHRVLRVFGDARFDPFVDLPFSLAPRESYARYRGLLGSASVAAARDCRARHRAALDRVERERGVSANVVAALIHVESHCGRNTGRSVVLHRLARLAMALEPANLRRNIDRHVADLPDEPAAAVARRTRARGKVLEEMFYPEVVATFRIAERLGVDPLGIRGSQAGAFGIPQFLPSSYLEFAVDGDGDGRVSLFDPEDAIASCANYLASHGWRPGLSHAERRRVLWSYNHSDAYIDTVLAIASRI